MDDPELEEQLDPEDFDDPSPSPADDVDLSVLCDALQEHGVTSVVVRYTGSGDSGGVESVEYVPQDISLPRWIERKLLDVAENYCPPGYENNDGGYGTLTVWPFEGLATLKHFDRYEGAEAIDLEAVPLPEGLCQRLAQLGVLSALARFDGYGDSGQIEELTVEPQPIVLANELTGELEDFLLSVLPDGLEINEGGHATFVVDVQARSVEVDAYWRVERAEETQTRWRWRK